MDECDICSKDPDLDHLYEEISGRKNESIFYFLRRSFKETCRRIAEPSKATYESRDLNFTQEIGSCNPWTFEHELTEFDITSRGLNLHCALWKARPTDAPSNVKFFRKGIPCIIYTHTNTRSLADATELQPLAARTGFHVIAFDMPGAGKSSGALSASCAAVVDHLSDIIKWAESHLDTTEIMLWARGMSTAAAIEYTCTSITRGYRKEMVKCLVLDTPYCSVKEVVDGVVEKYREKSALAVVSPLFYACAMMFGREVTSNLGADIYAVKPINSACSNKTPCLILCATNDDFIPPSHSDCFVRLWGGPVSMVSMSGTHYSRRSRDDVLAAASHIRRYIPSLC